MFKKRKLKRYCKEQIAAYSRIMSASNARIGSNVKHYAKGKVEAYKSILNKLK